MADNIIRNIPYVGFGSWQQPVPTVSDLPGFGNDVGDVRVTQDTFDIYEWNGTSWMLIAGPTFVSGIVSLNGLTANTQFFSTGTAGTDFNIASSIATHTFNIPSSSAANRGLLTAADWITFNNKQPAGNYITALTGDVTATGPGSVAAILATVNSNVGTFGSSTSIPTFTVNAKGLITAASGNAVIAPAGTLTGTTLAANVVNSSLTSVGTIGTGTWQGTVIGIAYGGTNNSVAYTAGSIIFSNGTSLTQDNANFYWDDTNKAMGIGMIPNSATAIDILNSSATSKPVQITGYGTGSNSVFRGRFARGTSVSPTAVQSGDFLSVFSGRGYGASQFAAASTGVMNIVAGETFTNTSNLTYLQFLTTPTGSVTAAESMRIASTGITLGPQSSSTAIHQTSGGMRVTTRTITTNLTIDTTTSDYIIFCNQSGAITITLPTPTDGRILIIKDISGTANTNNITIAQHSTEKIEGLAASKLLETNWGSWTFSSNGTDWWMI